MSPVCILTDSTAQFPTPVFDGRQLVNVVPLHVQLDQTFYENGNGLKAADLPASTHNNGLKPQVQAPSVEIFEEKFSQLSGYYEEIIAVLHAGGLTPIAKNAQQAAENLEGQTKVHIVDTGTTAIGLGLLVQAASAAAEAEMPGAEIERLLRSVMPRVYTVFCIEGLSYLQHSGYLNPSQALIGEYLNVLQVFSLDQGQLTPTQKARSYRQLVDILHEFLWEFPELDHIGLLQGAPPFETETRALRERIAEDFPETPVSEHIISAPLATLMGPRSLGMFVMQSEGGFDKRPSDF